MTGTTRRADTPLSRDATSSPRCVEFGCMPRLILYDKRADIHEAFLSLGCALICRQPLRKGWMAGRAGVPFSFAVKGSVAKIGVDS